MEWGWRRLSPRAWVVILPVLVIGLLGYVIAGVIGKVFAEIIIDTLWPLAVGIRAAASPSDVRSAASRAPGGIALGPLRAGASAGPFASSRSLAKTMSTDEDAEPELPESRPRSASAGGRPDAHGRR